MLGEKSFYKKWSHLNEQLGSYYQIWNLLTFII